MRGFFKCLSEESQEMVAGETRFFRYLVETQGMIVTMVDKFPRSTESLEGVDILQRSCFVQFHDHFCFESLRIRSSRQDSSA